MGPRNTRAKIATAAPDDPPRPQLIRDEEDAQRLFILPKNASEKSRIVSLLNPATATAGRYLYCPVAGLYEFTRVTAPRKEPRSSLVVHEPVEDARTVCHTSKLDNDDEQPRTSIGKGLQEGQNGYIMEQADIFVATPMDPLFLLTPLLSTSHAMFRPAEDYLDQLSESSTHMSQMLRETSFRKALLQRLSAISDTQDLGDGDIVYRPQLSRMACLLVDKAVRMTEKALGTSLEDTFVRRQLEVPMAGKRREVSDEEENFGARDNDQHKPIARPDIPSQVVKLMRQRIALDYIMSSYIAPSLRRLLVPVLMDAHKTDDTLLEQHLDRVKSAQAEVQALRLLSDNISRKRTAYEDDEAAEERADKKRKKEDEEKRKKAASRASKELKKVDTSGMKKLSSFFTKTAPTTRSQTTAS